MENSEELNRYYELVNEYIDAYVDKWNIHPKSLDKYLSNSEKFDSFVERNGLSDIKLINHVIKDVINDRKAMVEDGVLTFESFNISESIDHRIEKIQECLYKGIDKANIKHEKILADHFDVSLSHIDIKDSGKHHFEIENKGGCIIYTNSELKTIKLNLIAYAYNQLITETVKIANVGVKIPVEKFIDKDKYDSAMDETLNKDKVCKSIGKILSVKEDNLELSKYGLIIKYEWGGISEH